MNEQHHIDLITKASAIVTELQTTMVNTVAANSESVTEHNLLMATVLVMATANAVDLLDIAIPQPNVIMVAKVAKVVKGVRINGGATEGDRAALRTACERLMYLVGKLGG